MQSWNAAFFLFFVGYSLGGGGGISGRVRALNLTVPLGSGRVGSDNLGYGPGSGFSFEPVQTSSAGPHCLCTSCAQNDAFEATLSHSVQAHIAYAHPVRRMMRLKQHWVTACRPTLLMHIPCAEWCVWSNTESQRAGPHCLCTSRAQNDALEATLHLGLQLTIILIID